MKTTKTLLFLLFLLFFNFIHASANVNYKKGIQVIQEENLLSAPLAVSYQWFFNGKKLSHTMREIKVMSAGTYTVVITDENGNQESHSSAIAFNQESEIYIIYIIGDSTAANWASGFYPLTGWGQVLRHFFTSSVVIENKALSARSAKSFYNDHWAPIREGLEPGDYVFIQFGINDANSDDPERYSDPFTTFQDYLTLFVEETQAKGAYPVLLTTVRRNAWNFTVPPTLYDAYHDYPVATRQLAGELQVPLIDLDQLSVPLMESLGPDYTGPFMYLVLDTAEYTAYPTGKTDNVHFQEMGAIEVARLVTESIADFGYDTVMNKLIPFIKPVYEVAVKTNFPEGAIITRTAGYPEGTPVTIKARLDPAYDLLEWQDESGNPVCNDDRYTFTMRNKALSFTAVLDDDPVPDCSGEYNGSAYIDDCGDCVEGNTGFLPCCITLHNDTFKIKSIASDLCLQELTIEGEEGTFIGLKPCLNDKAQEWIFTREGNSYMIRNLASDLFLFSGSLSLVTFLSTDDQEMFWRIEKSGEDTFCFSPEEKWEISIDIYGNSLEEGYYLWLSGRKESLYQRFAILKNDINNCSIYPDLCTAINVHETYPDNITIHPNPFSDQAFVSSNQDENAGYAFRLYDLKGNLLTSMERINTGKQFFGEGLPAGLYIAKIIGGEKVWTKKLIKK
ncbi:MAG: T9SS type A sorting domain-containing protein [Bacteroidales bacterium]|nr:T9SS type A sorting domain-containing protein [Bacteroidales bacterium]